MIVTRALRITTPLLLVAALTACEEPAPARAGHAEREVAVAAAAEPAAARVLATVDGSPITEAELALALDRVAAGAGSASQIAVLRKNLLDMLVKSRALSLQAEQAMSAAEQQALHLQVQRYREELLVTRQLQALVKPQPVSVAMVKQYYAEHPDQFGAVERKTFEYITVAGDLSAEQKSQLLVALRGLKNEGEWELKARQLAQQQNLPLKYQRAQIDAALLDQPLKSMVTSLQPASAPLLESDYGIYLVRVLAVEQMPPKALAEVSAEIRKMLAPIQLKKALADISAQAVAKADVVYIDAEPQVQKP